MIQRRLPGVEVERSGLSYAKMTKWVDVCYSVVFWKWYWILEFKNVSLKIGQGD